MNGGWQATWAQALDELELDVAAVEAQLAERRDRELPLIDPWTPPPGLGPLPLDLRPRADAILERQLAAALALVAALTSNRRQATVAGRLQSPDPAPRPAYVDCAM
jgi:hypothetical protein